MKTKSALFILVVAGILLYPGHCFTQKSFIGIKAGLSVSYFSKMEKIENGTRLPLPGAVAGISYEYLLSKFFSIQPELLYAQRGMHFKLTYSENETEAERIILNTVQLPFLFKFRYPIGSWSIFAETGVYGQFAFNGKSVSFKTDDRSNKDRTDLKFEKDGWQRWDAGIPVGIGSNVKLGPGVLFLDCRFDIGLIDIMNMETKPSDYKAHYNRSGEITLGYLFGLGGKSKKPE